MSEDMSTKPYLGLIIIQSTKYMNGSRFYPPSDTEHHQFMKLHNFTVT